MNFIIRILESKRAQTERQSLANESKWTLSSLNGLQKAASTQFLTIMYYSKCQIKIFLLFDKWLLSLLFLSPTVKKCTNQSEKLCTC